MSTWLIVVLCIFVFLFFAGVTCLILLSISKRQDEISSPTTPPPASSSGRHTEINTTTQIKGSSVLSKIKEMLVVLMMLVCLFVLSVWAIRFYKWINEPSAPPRSTMRGGREKQIYHFDNSECLFTQKLHDGRVDFYPKGGEIIIYPPSPAKPWHDKPGVAPGNENDWNKLPPGVYKDRKSVV